MKFNRIAVLSDTNLPTEIQEAINHYSETPVDFSSGDIGTEEALVKQTADAQAILVAWRANLTRSYFESCPDLKYVGVCATSTSSIDIEAAKDHGVTVKNVIDYGDEATAEYIFMQLLKLVRGDGEYSWRASASELNGKTIGIVGLGAVGQQVARLALGFNMKVIYYSRTRKTEWEKRGLRYKPLAELLSTSEIVSISVPRGTRILGSAEFKLIHPGTILVQTSIGNIIDDVAFRSWIDHSQNFAIMDYSVGDAYYQAYKDLPRVIFPKLVAGYTIESKTRLGQKVLANIKAYLDRK